MNIKGTLGALMSAAVLASLSGCLAQNTQTQGLQNTQLANDPCAPSATSNLIATGRSLLDMANTVLETQQSFNGNSATYAKRMEVAENAQKVNQGNNVLNNIENLAGAGQQPCVPAAPASAAR
ncbi:hypothetical protein DP090_017630 [Pseudomonas sp. MDMC216]|uniref:Secreted protein n=1 Tax=Pseudomonas sediminis TaxID=1691904 RepID=A0ABX6SK42_9PSED|nr:MULTISPECIES: hypothetical protein [Pseudomonas]MCW1938548.1 hypothetical protein [Pseudomonas sp. MDMC_285]MDI5994836.1 hypothetical protein [Pseudomonas sp. MDMC216]MDI6009076.1 hypothetical protein [Pseudomonas sp. MDMC17]QNH01982.1 hypothetical protein HNQ25_04380 [Pseudomonas sediminis]RAR31140.1 hypothetical protein DP092_21430 [Pseudomonas sp. MDMC224]